MPDNGAKVDESKLSASSPPPPTPPSRPLSYDRVEPSGDRDPKKDGKRLMDVVEPTVDEAAAAAAALSRYSSAEAAASFALRKEKDPDASWASITNNNNNDDDHHEKDHPPSPATPIPSAPLLRQANLPPALPSRPTALPVPQQYRLRAQDLDPQKTDSLAGAVAATSSSSLRAPGAYAMAPRRFGNNATQAEADTAAAAAASNDQEEFSNSWSNNDDNTDGDNNNNNNNNTDAALFTLDLEDALDAQIVPERDLNHEVQRKMEALTIDALTVEVKTKKDTAARPSRSSGISKSVVLMMILFVVVFLVAIGIWVGAKNRKDTSNNNNNNNENESVKNDGPTSPPTVCLPDLEGARAIFVPLSGEDVLLDELSPQYKALWWIVHEDPTNMMQMTVQNETQSSKLRLLEKYAMAVLYFATDGSNWWDQLDFLGNTSVCEWDRAVECDGEGAVLILALGKL
jgi:hypothetical protein